MSRRMRVVSAAAFAVHLLGVTGAPVAPAGDSGSAPVSRVAFDEAVAAIFRSRCTSCHGATESSGGLRLDSYDAVMRGGDRGPVVVPGNPSSSLLMRKILRRDEPAMPPKLSLPTDEMRKIRRWIRLGAGP